MISMIQIATLCSSRERDHIGHYISTEPWDDQVHCNYWELTLASYSLDLARFY